jgi:hypothetical protein
MTWFADRIATPARAWWDSRPAAGGPWRHQLLREVGLVAALFALYNVGRLLAAQRVSGAFDNADRLWQLERWLGLPSEQAWQAVAMDVPSLIRAANGYYASVHFPLTFLVLLWLFLPRPDTYLWARRSIVWGSAAALVVQVLLPMAPPRMLGNLASSTQACDTGSRSMGPSDRIRWPTSSPRCPAFTSVGRARSSGLHSAAGIRVGAGCGCSTTASPPSSWS